MYSDNKRVERRRCDEETYVNGASILQMPAILKDNKCLDICTTVISILMLWVFHSADEYFEISTNDMESFAMCA
jgi:hypothetical protein